MPNTGETHNALRGAPPTSRIDDDAADQWQPPVADAATDDDDITEDEFVASLSPAERRRYDVAYKRVAEAEAENLKAAEPDDRWMFQYRINITAMTYAINGLPADWPEAAELNGDDDDLDIDDIDDCDPADDEPDFVRDWVDED